MTNKARCGGISFNHVTLYMFPAKLRLHTASGHLRCDFSEQSLRMRGNVIIGGSHGCFLVAAYRYGAPSNLLVALNNIKKAFRWAGGWRGRVSPQCAPNEWFFFFWGGGGWVETQRVYEFGVPVSFSFS